MKVCLRVPPARSAGRLLPMLRRRGPRGRRARRARRRDSWRSVARQRAEAAVLDALDAAGGSRGRSRARGRRSSSTSSPRSRRGSIPASCPATSPSTPACAARAPPILAAAAEAGRRGASSPRASPSPTPRGRRGRSTASRTRCSSSAAPEPSDAQRRRRRRARADGARRRRHRAALRLLLRCRHARSPTAARWAQDARASAGLPIVGTGAGLWSFIHVDDAVDATVLVARCSTDERGAYNIVDDDPARVSEWLPALAEALGAPRPRRVPAALARLAAGSYGVAVMTERAGASNERQARARRGRPRTRPGARASGVALR